MMTKNRKESLPETTETSTDTLGTPGVESEATFFGSAETKPSNKWAQVSKEDLTKPWKDLSENEDEKAKTQEPEPAMEVKIELWTSRFFYGYSAFVFSEPIVRRIPIVNKKKLPLNIDTVATEAEKKAFAEKLAKNIGEFRDLFMDILPITMSLHSAATDVREKVQQITEERDIKLPVDYVKFKLIQAAQIRISRKVKEMVGLTEQELLMLYEDLPDKLLTELKNSLPKEQTQKTKLKKHK